jgi:hypothetical protein
MLTVSLCCTARRDISDRKQLEVRACMRCCLLFVACALTKR